MKKLFAFWVPHVLLLWFMAGSAVFYFLDTPAVIQIFAELGYPAYTVYFNAVAKILGGIAITFPQFPRWMKEFAYAGYLYIILLAVQAVYLMKSPAEGAFMLLFVVLWAWAYWIFRKRSA